MIFSYIYLILSIRLEKKKNGQCLSFYSYAVSRIHNYTFKKRQKKNAQLERGHVYIYQEGKSILVACMYKKRKTVIGKEMCLYHLFSLPVATRHIIDITAIIVLRLAA